MSNRAWSVLCDLVEFHHVTHYADLYAKDVMQEMFDRRLVAMIGNRLILTPHGLREYYVIN